MQATITFSHSSSVVSRFVPLFRYWTSLEPFPNHKIQPYAPFYDPGSIFVSNNSGASWTNVLTAEVGQGLWQAVVSSYDGSTLVVIKQTFFDAGYPCCLHFGRFWLHLDPANEHNGADVLDIFGQLE